MPKKLQIKMLSDAGELLNVVTCASGNISVFRAHSAADLRPYQRALAGVPTKERFVITIDGTEYSPTDVNMIGFGEGPIQSNLSTRDYLLDMGSSEEAVDALLLSIGLERYADTPCSALPADEERRTRLVAATLQPQRALIVNEPFEPISSQWRERTADILSSCARAQNALVVIPSLSFRPEGWIDNPAVARIQVGQTLQKTIGFGAAGSAANELMEELKKRVRAQEDQYNSSSATAAATMATSVAIPVTKSVDSIPELAAKATPTSFFFLSSKVKLSLGALTVTCAALCVALSYIPNSPTADKHVAASVTHTEPPPPPPMPQTKESPVSLPQPSGDAAQQVAALANLAVLPSSEEIAPPKRKGTFVLDGYPVQIKEALLATVHGAPSEIKIAEASLEGGVAVAPAAPKNGNLFKLLEQAGSSTAQNAGESAPSSFDYQSGPPPPEPWAPEEQTLEDPENAEARREAIRQKFLEAIRAAAERRENEIGAE